MDGDVFSVGLADEVVLESDVFRVGGLWLLLLLTDRGREVSLRPLGPWIWCMNRSYVHSDPRFEHRLQLGRASSHYRYG